MQIETITGNSFAYYAVPISAGLVRTFAVRATARKPLFVAPRWFDHLQRNSLVEDDLKLMITQEGEMRRVAVEKGLSDFPAVWAAYHMPTASDRLIVEMRRWLATHAPGPDADWFGLADDGEANVEKFGKRFDGHVAGCASCSRLSKSLGYTEAILKIAVGGAIWGSLWGPMSSRHECGIFVWYGGIAVLVFGFLQRAFRERDGQNIGDLGLGMYLWDRRS